MIHPFRDRYLNKGTAFTEEERINYNIVGRLPYKVETLQEQCQRLLLRFGQMHDNIQRWLLLSYVQDQNETLFTAFCLRNLRLVLPVLYTPTIGNICKQYSDIWEGHPRGLYISRRHKGIIKQILEDWPDEPHLIMCTDATRILGLGDQGTGGHQIPVGKLTLYSIGAGFHPKNLLPISFDLGTNNKELQDAPFYLGSREPRNKDQEYFDIIDETINAVHELWPHCLFQFEDFSADTSFRLLNQHRFSHNHPVYNDDILGAGCIATATIAGGLRALKLRGFSGKASDQRYLVYGAGAAGIGIVNSVSQLLVQEGLTIEEAHKRFYVVDSHGLLTTDRTDYKDASIPDQKKDLCRSDVHHDDYRTLLDCVREFKPTVLVGVSTQGKAFNKEVIQTMNSQIQQNPIILAMSNPLVKAECTNQEAYDWTDGRVLFASGSPFQPILTNEGRTIETAQCNNFYIFPAIGLGSHFSYTNEVDDSMLGRIAQRLSEMVGESDLRAGRLLPPVTDIREISVQCAVAFIREAQRLNCCKRYLPTDDDKLADMIRRYQWIPKYH